MLGFYAFFLFAYAFIFILHSLIVDVDFFQNGDSSWFFMYLENHKMLRMFVGCYFKHCSSNIAIQQLPPELCYGNKWSKKNPSDLPWPSENVNG